MSNPPSEPDFEARLRVVEREVVRLREQVALSSADATAARVLAAGADQDVSEVRAELRAHTLVLNALRETQLEQGDAITGLHAEITGLHAEMHDGFATVNAGMAQIVTRLAGIAGTPQEE